MILKLLIVLAAPMPPGLAHAGIGEDHVNITWIPGTFDEDKESPVGTEHYVKYRLKGETHKNKEFFT